MRKLWNSPKNKKENVMQIAIISFIVLASLGAILPMGYAFFLFFQELPSIMTEMVASFFNLKKWEGKIK